MKKLHVFNPDHDLALAFGGPCFTPPAAGRGMRFFLGALPAIWADDGDIILLDNMEEGLTLMAEHADVVAKVRLMTKEHVRSMTADQWDDVAEVSPWGWNAALVWQLERMGVPSRLLPDKGRLAAIRKLSNRESSIDILREMVAAIPKTVGWRGVAHSVEEVKTLLIEQNGGVVKAPWSSSGRGVRFSSKVMTANMEGFVRNVLGSQGSIIVEPAYKKVVDFAMEFVADGKGKAEYSGLSLFDTDNGAYLGNVLADEDHKLGSLSVYADVDVLKSISSRLSSLLGKWCQDVYNGPLGVDMMVVDMAGDYFLHPCVEINLRRTMGHVALDLTRHSAGRHSVMRITCEKGRYSLNLS